MNWVSVTERMPEEGVDVWMWDDEDVNLGFYEDGQWRYTTTGEWCSDGLPVIAWQPIEKPEPPC